MNDVQIKEADTKIKQLKVGDVVTLAEMYGSDWVNISSKTKFGEFFIENVKNNTLKGLKILNKKSNNHQVYEKK